MDKNYTQTGAKMKRPTQGAQHIVGPERKYLVNE